MTATDFQMQPLDLSCPERKNNGYPPEDLSCRRRRPSTSPPPLVAVNSGIHSRIRIRADLTNSRGTVLTSDSYHNSRRIADDEEDHESSASVEDKPTDLRRIIPEGGYNRPVGNPRKRFLSKYLHNDLSVEEVMDEGVENDRHVHPGKIKSLRQFNKF